jgi:proteasome lid subunit RPN8/RPN11
VVYHSHSATEAYPSRTDIRWAATAGFAYWLVLSTRADEDEVRAFTIDDGVVTEVTLTLV